MKEINANSQEPQEQVDQTQVKKNAFRKTFNVHYNHSVFEINTITGDIAKAKYDTGSINLQTGKVIKNLIEEPNCIYIPALNMINAQRKFDNIVRKVKAKDDK